MLTSYLHAVLRISPESPVSLYRVLVPTTLFVLIFFHKKSLKPTFIFILILINSLFLSFNYEFDVFQSWAFLLHYVAIFNLFMIVFYLFNTSKFNLLYVVNYYFFIVSLVLAWLEYAFNFQLPNTAFYNDGSVSAFNWNQNELATALLSFVPLLLFYEKRLAVKVVLMFLLVVLLYINDAKFSLLGISFGFIAYFFKHVFWSMGGFGLLSLMILGGFLIMPFIVSYGTMTLLFSSYGLGFNELLLDPLVNILTLTPYDNAYGSIPARVNAIIYAIYEFREFGFLGIGAGNTVLMLTKPEYFIPVASSIHNLPVQLVVENGFIVLIGYIFVLMFYFRILIKPKLQLVEKVLLFGIPTIIVGVMGSSGGVFSTYYFWSNLFIIILLYRKYYLNKFIILIDD